ncbi:MAG: hypothetical protein P4L85_08165 [Paludisphaera borealis]|uniref:hypothetical protein n=1 Tax=Paludisphaera borealis TaxID=1387353 RepID=UPI002846586E|nr:hypothetical protein [Paludisphaera borealis]MDR3619310.1 hypothetical protein [Paludisphaera borealis]
MGIRFSTAPKDGVKHRLDPPRIVETAENLAREIDQRLPGSTLSGLAAELVQIAHCTDERASRARRPIYAVRAASLAAIVAAASLLGFIGFHVHARWVFGTITEVFEATDAGFNLVAILAGALWFLASFEARIKRRRVLGYIEELREFIHVIDVTQLYFTPDLYRPEAGPPLGGRKLDHTYLLFCTEMLAVIGNLAPLYARGASGDTVLRAVADVDLLANSIALKLQSKAEAVRLGRRSSE